MSQSKPLLMIPGPIEVSPAVRAAFEGPPPSHLAPHVIEAFGASLERMRSVWMAGDDSQPFLIAGGGTVAMDMAAANLIEPGETAVVVSTGYFSDRMAEMIRRQGGQVVEIAASVGDAPNEVEVEASLAAMKDRGGVKALFATHVDTSTGVRVDPAPLARLAREYGALSVFDGVCATAAEEFRMAEWGADVYLTASQKAIGLPAGLALFVASPQALEARERRQAKAPAMYLDWHQWLPIMTAYEERRPSYFSTPATNLVTALAVGLEEILADGMDARFALHEKAARALRAAWSALGLSLVPARPELAANALSALRFPEGVDGSLVGRIGERGVVVAGGLHPKIRAEYFRVGHMGWTLSQAELLERTVEAVAAALADSGAAVDPSAAKAAFSAELDS